jgi:hypothetical protein
MFKKIVACSLLFLLSGAVMADDDKGDLEDFADDFGEEESDDDGGYGTEHFFYFILDNIDIIVHMWGRAPGTEFGPYPSHPYADGPGFMSLHDDFRSYFFNTEIGYNYLSGDLRSYLLRWDSQFIGSSKLSFDLAVYEEKRLEDGYRYNDHLTFLGIRYGHAFFRSPQMLVNIEGGLRSMYRNGSHSGPEIAMNLQLFPGKPLILETEVAAAYLFGYTRGAPLYTIESSAGILLGRVEILGGIRILKNRSQDLLDGFRLGIRIWY